MIKFLKSLFGLDVPDTPVIAQEKPKEPQLIVLAETRL